MRYFSFEIDGQKVGYYEEEDADGVFYCNALLVMEGQQYENSFWVKYDADKILAYKCGDGEYIDFDQPEGVYPSSGLNLAIRDMGARNSFVYRCLFEGTGEVEEDVALRREGDRVVEYVASQPQRYVKYRDGEVVEYGWGGTAISKLVSSREEAVADTAFA